MGEVRIYNFDIRLKRSLKQDNCPLQRSNFIRDLELFYLRGRAPGHTKADTSKRGGFGRDLFFWVFGVG
jgi:hypothetical protein